MSDTKVAFAERTIRSLKNINYGYIEDYGQEYVHKLSQFVTILNSRKKLHDRLDTKNCQRFRLFVHSVQQASTRI